MNIHQENDSVSYIYYPSSSGKQGHAALEIGGNCWSASCTAEKHSSLEKKILHSSTVHPSKPWRMKGRYFKRYILSATPEEVVLLKKAVAKGIPLDQSSTSSLLLSMAKNLTYKTCSYHALTKLAEGCNFNVPLPYKISPFLTDLYIKYYKPTKIKSVETYGKRLGFEGEINECIMLSSVSMLASVAIFHLYQALQNYTY